MDRIDLKILAELESDGRLSFADLSERVGLSKSPCWTRVRDLEAEGAIQGFSAQISPAALGLAVQCYASVRISFDAHAAFEEAATAHPAIIECHTTAGDSDYLIRVYARSVEHLDDLLRHELSKLAGRPSFVDDHLPQDHQIARAADPLGGKLVAVRRAPCHAPCPSVSTNGETSDHS